MTDPTTGKELSTPAEDAEYECIRGKSFPVIRTAIGCRNIKALAAACEHGNCVCASAASNVAGKLVWG